jgi:hypothetical protein
MDFRCCVFTGKIITAPFSLFPYFPWSGMLARCYQQRDMTSELERDRKIDEEIRGLRKAVVEGFVLLGH